jgi:hypothetical protein
MPCFQVTVKSQTGGEDVTVAALQSLSEARRLADAIRHFEPRISCDVDPALTIGLDDPIPAEWAPRFTPEERAQIERSYLDARAEMLACGATQARVDSVLPLTADGRVPWN